jgi:DNA polymerase-4
VQPDRERKSYGKETTLNADIDDTNQMMDILDDLAGRVMEGLRREDRQGLTLTLKVKYHDFQSVTRSVTFPEPISDMDLMHGKNKKVAGQYRGRKQKGSTVGDLCVKFYGARKENEGWVQLPLPFGIKG